MTSNAPNPHATAHKVAHNITTLANIVLVGWLFCSIYALSGSTYEEFSAWMANPVNIVAAILFVIVTLRHFSLELQVVMEDYISCVWFRHLKIHGMNIVFLILGIATIVSILKIAFTG